MQKSIPLLCLILLAALLQSCKKEGVNQKNSPAILLSKIIDNKINDTASFFYDEQNRLLAMSSANQFCIVSKFDNRNNIIETRDSGFVPGGFGVGSYFKQKNIFSYDSENRIIKMDLYNLTDPFFPDTSRPGLYAIFSYYADSITIQNYYFNVSAGNYSTDYRKISRVKIDATGNALNFLIDDDSSYLGYPEYHHYTADYTNNLKNPLRLLPQAIVFSTQINYFALSGSNAILMEYSESCAGKAISEDEYYNFYSSSLVKYETTTSNSFTESSTATGYPASIIQTDLSKYTNQTTGETTNYNNVSHVEYQYIKK